LDQQLPSLNEALLAESDNHFASAVRRRTCTTATPGFVPVIQYSCEDSLGDRYIVAVNSDTQRMVARLKLGNTPWQTTNLPQLSAGIDWNCDGSSAPAGQTVQANINGGINNGGINTKTKEPDWYSAGSATEILASTNDWQVMPSQAGRGCQIRQNASTYLDGTGQPIFHPNMSMQSALRTASCAPQSG
jgi:hypothetical protein